MALDHLESVPEKLSLLDDIKDLSVSINQSRTSGLVCNGFGSPYYFISQSYRVRSLPVLAAES